MVRCEVFTFNGALYTSPVPAGHEASKAEYSTYIYATTTTGARDVWETNNSPRKLAKPKQEHRNSISCSVIQDYWDEAAPFLLLWRPPRT